MFCFKNYEVEPDIMTLAKALGGGLPIGTMVVGKDIADTLGPGTHASTFGGSPLVCRAALGVFKAIQKEKMLTNVVKMSEYLFAKLEELKKKHSQIVQIRGMGLMLGIELNIPGKEIVEKALNKGLLINCTHDKILRLMPALNIKKKHIDKAIKILDGILSQG